MRKRVRHFNPAHAGASCVLDSRYITGLSNGDSIGTWVDRTGSNSPSQSVSANKPVYTVAVQGGNPSVRNNSGQGLIFSQSPISGATQVSAIYAATRLVLDTQNCGAVLVNFGSNSEDDHEPWSDSNAYLGFASTTRKQISLWNPNIVANNSPYTGAIISRAGLWSVYVRGSLVLSTTINTISIGNFPRIGCNFQIQPSGTNRPDYIFRFNGHIFFVSLFRYELSDSLRKRFNSCVAFSFKIQSS